MLCGQGGDGLHNPRDIYVFANGFLGLRNGCYSSPQL